MKPVRHFGRCARHGCDLVRKPWCKPRRGRARNDVLVCLPCVEEARAKVHASMANQDDQRRPWNRKRAA